MFAVSLTLLFYSQLVVECKINGPNLLEAARYGSVEQVMALASLGPHVTNYRDAHGWTALHGACFEDSFAPQTIRILVQNGARVNTRTAHGYTALIEACATDKSNA